MDILEKLLHFQLLKNKFEIITIFNSLLEAIKWLISCLDSPVVGLEIRYFSWYTPNFIDVERCYHKKGGCDLITTFNFTYGQLQAGS